MSLQVAQNRHITAREWPLPADPRARDAKIEQQSATLKTQAAKIEQLQAEKQSWIAEKQSWAAEKQGILADNERLLSQLASEHEFKQNVYNIVAAQQKLDKR